MISGKTFFYLVMEYNIFSNDPTQQTVHHYSLLCVFGMLYTLRCTKPLDCADDGVKKFFRERVSGLIFMCLQIH